ncbi:hypothetical protein F2Q69_00026347 [Brassica cretica]|uniref:Uncharacterized protein n=1 Tax=Brassica cretica TaxID=69181 RepID=A0A8S9S041_BRACR|nr:hypothetical protein F2Q69_00026347 [Brassica cretica]
MHGLMSYRCSEGFDRYTATELRLEPGCYVATERDERSVATSLNEYSSKLTIRGRYEEDTIDRCTSVGTEIRTVDFRLNKETRKALISQRTRISANYHTSSNQNTRITTIRIRNRKREQSRSYSESAYERLQQGISLGSRSVGEIPSSSNPKTAKTN